MNKKNNPVEIVPNDLGAKIRVSANNPEYAHVLLRQQKTVISPKGWVNSKTVHALLHGKLESIQDIGIASKDTMAGQIVVKESLTPFNHDNPDMDLKRAGSGKDAVICCSHGEPIFRKGFYDPTMLDVDEFIPHTNGDYIRKSIAVDGSVEAEASFIKALTSDSTPKQPDNQVDLEDSIAEVEAEDKMTPLEQELDELLDKSEDNTRGGSLKKQLRDVETEIEDLQNEFDDVDDESEYSGNNIPKNVKVEDEDIDAATSDPVVYADDVEVEDEVEVEVDNKDFEFNL